MNGIFQYQVPGQVTLVNQPQQKQPKQVLTTGQADFNQQLSVISPETSHKVSRVFLKLWQQLQFHRKEQQAPKPDKPVSDISTHSLGEEEGQPIAAPAYTHPGKLLKKPEATTLVVGEEDAGAMGAVGNAPGGVTTFALGEEEGATPPMIKIVTPEGKVQMTTQALGEEDGL